MTNDAWARLSDSTLLEDLHMERRHIFNFNGPVYPQSLRSGTSHA